jgi:hypothetical protein
LGLDSANVFREGIFGKQLSFVGFAAGVTDHSGSTADESDWLMARLLEAAQHHQR